MIRRIHYLLRIGYFIVLVSVANTCHALINGLHYPAETVSTVRLHIQHEHFLRSVSRWEYYDSFCSAVVVGVEPLTLITAAHCLKEVKLTGPKQLPELKIWHAESLGIEVTQIENAFYRPYEEVAENIALDIAVLVFDASVHQRIKPVTISKTLPSEETPLLLCGYGKSHLEIETMNPRCGQRFYLKDFINFETTLPLAYKSTDEMLYIKSESQFHYTKEIVSSPDALVAINRLNPQGNYDGLLPMVTEGDSGGAWLVTKPDQEFSLVAISTMVERFYNKNIYWTFFNKDTPLSDYPYIAYGLRMDTQAIQTFLEYCKNSGADIDFDNQVSEINR